MACFTTRVGEARPSDWRTLLHSSAAGWMERGGRRTTRGCNLVLGRQRRFLPLLAKCIRRPVVRLVRTSLRTWGRVVVFGDVGLVFHTPAGDGVAVTRRMVVDPSQAAAGTPRRRVAGCRASRVTGGGTRQRWRRCGSSDDVWGTGVHHARAPALRLDALTSRMRRHPPASTSSACNDDSETKSSPTPTNDKYYYAENRMTLWCTVAKLWCHKLCAVFWTIL